MNSLRPLAAGAFLALFVASAATAQEPTGVSSEVERTASTSPQEKIAYAESSNNEIREAEKTISKLLEQARKDGDAEAIECLINKLTSVRALLQVSESAEVSMRDAIAGGEDEMANHEFRKIAVAVSKTRSLMAEAQRCAADQDLAPGETYVDWESRLDGPTTFDDNVDTIDIDVDVPDISGFR